MSRTITMRKGTAALGRRFRERLAPRLIADMRLPAGGIGSRAGYDEFERALVVVFIVSFRAQRDHPAEKIDADAPAHANDNGLAVHRRKALLAMRDQIASNRVYPVVGPDDRFELGSTWFQFLFPLDLSPLVNSSNSASILGRSQLQFELGEAVS